MSDVFIADATQLDQAAGRLTKVKQDLLQQARTLRSTAEGVPSFRGREADRFRQNSNDMARSLEKLAESVDQQARALRLLAQKVRDLNRG